MKRLIILGITALVLTVALIGVGTIDSPVASAAPNVDANCWTTGEFSFECDNFLSFESLIILTSVENGHTLRCAYNATFLGAVLGSFYDLELVHQMTQQCPNNPPGTQWFTNS